MLRYAVANAPKGATINFDASLNGHTIALDPSSPNNHIWIGRDVTIQGPAAGLLTINGGNATRIFFIAGGNITISGLTLANGLASGGSGAAGGGGGAAGMGGAIFLNGGVLTLKGVVLSGNRAHGGNGAAGSGLLGGGGGGGFGAGATDATGASGGDLGGTGGIPGTRPLIGPGDNGGPGGPGAGGGGGGSSWNAGSAGGPGGFAGGGGGGGGGVFHQTPGAHGGNGGAGGFAGGGGGGGFHQNNPGSDGADAAGGFGGGTAGGAGTGDGGNGGGGAGPGGAIFAAAGGLYLTNTTVTGNSTAGGTGAWSGQAKGGALFICSGSFCGADHEASFLMSGTFFQGNTASDAGAAHTCPGRDDADICGLVTAFTPTHFSVSVPGSALPGIPIGVTVTALDANNRVVLTYSGTVHFTSSDPLAVLPPDTTLSNGAGTFAATLATSGYQTIAVSDVAPIKGTSNAIYVGFPHLSVTAPATVTVGTGFFVTVKAVDAYGNAIPAYTGKVHFTSSDPTAVLSPDSFLPQGAGDFTSTLRTYGTWTITATDTASPLVTGTSGPVAAVYAGSLAASSVSPGFGGGPSGQFSFYFNDQASTQHLDVVNVLINNFLDGRGACYLAYSRPLNTLYLVNDEGTALLPGLPMNGRETIGNSQCSVDGTGSSVSLDGGVLTLRLALSFGAGFGGNKILYLAARDIVQGNTGWQALGTWNVPETTVMSPTVEGLLPARGSASGVLLRVTFSDTKGWQDLGVVNILINDFLDGRRACYLAYDRASSTLFLVNDAGTALLPGWVLNSPGGLSNGECSVRVEATSAEGDGNHLSLNLNLTFTSVFSGNRVIYLAARDVSDRNNSGWQAMGTWSVP